MFQGYLFCTETKVKSNCSQPAIDKEYYWLASKDVGKTVTQSAHKIDFKSTKIKKDSLINILKMPH